MNDVISEPITMVEPVLIKHQYAIDFEYWGDDGDRVNPVCMVWADLKNAGKNSEYPQGWSKEEKEAIEYHHVWRDELLEMDKPPFPTGEDSLVWAYYWPAEGSAFEALGWEQPENIIDCFAEFRSLTNGRQVKNGSSLLGAMTWYGCPSMASEMKETMRDLILSGGPWNDDEKTAILGYCKADVQALVELIEVMEPDIHPETALFRGRFMSKVAEMEYNGIPIDVPILEKIRSSWPLLMERVIAQVDRNFGVYEGTVFKQDKFGDYINRHGMQWPRTPIGRFDLSDATFRAKAEQYPQLSALRELRSTLSQTRNLGLTVGIDGRNRCMLSPFRSKTGRSQPSNQKFVFGPSKWVRHLIKPEEGTAVSYIDYSQQEWAIAGKLSECQAMMYCYLSDDPYIEFAKMAKAVPKTATKDSHPVQRQQFKVCSLGVLFGLTGEGMARKLGIPSEGGRQLLRLHKNVFPEFWKWQEQIIANALLNMEMQTVMGWKMYVPPRTNLRDRNKERTLANFPMQGNGSEMLRIAVILASEMGVKILAPIHDALLVESKLEDIDETVALTQKAMADASATILDGFRLRTDVEIVRYPDRYTDERGAEMWSYIMDQLPN